MTIFFNKNPQKQLGSIDISDFKDSDFNVLFLAFFYEEGKSQDGNDERYIKTKLEI